MRERFLRRFRGPRAALAAAAAAVGLALAWPAGRHLWALSQFRAAQEALGRQDLAAARERLRRCLAVWPRGKETRLLAARAARRAGEYDEAAEHLRAYERLGGDADAVALEWAMLRAQKDAPLHWARFLTAQVKQGHPDAVLILEAITEGYLRHRRLPEALAGAEELLRRQPGHVRGLLWLGSALEQLNRHAEALEHYREAVARDPDNEWARLSLGELLLHHQRPEEALAHFEEVRRRRPDNPAVLLGLARCRRALGEPAEARRLLDAVLADWPREPLALRERGQLALDDGQAARAEHWLRQAAALAPADRQALYALGQCLRQLGKAEEAREVHARVERLDADLKELAALTEQVVKSPRAPEARYQAGLLCLRLGREADGLQWLASALEEDPGHAAARQALAAHRARPGAGPGAGEGRGSVRPR